MSAKVEKLNDKCAEGKTDLTDLRADVGLNIPSIQ